MREIGQRRYRKQSIRLFFHDIYLFLSLPSRGFKKKRTRHPSDATLERRGKREIERVSGNRKRGGAEGGEGGSRWINQSESASFSRDIVVSSRRSCWRKGFYCAPPLGVEPSSVSKGAPRISIYLFHRGRGREGAHPS